MDTTEQKMPAIRKAFFGKDTCLVFQANTQAKKVFLNIGKKGVNAWAWVKAKISDEEMGDILRVLERGVEQASFYHKYEGKETKIWVSRKEEDVLFRIDEQSKALSPAQQAVMAILIRHAVVAMSIDDEPRTGGDSVPQETVQ